MRVKCINAENTGMEKGKEYVVIEEYKDRYTIIESDGQIAIYHIDRFEVPFEKLSIQLKNIDLSSVKGREQASKVSEEYAEFADAIMIANNRQNIMEEFYDTLQAMMGLMYKLDKITAEEIMRYYPTHLEKLKNRPRNKEEK